MWEDADRSTPHHTLGLGSKLYRSIESELSKHTHVFILFGFDCSCVKLPGLPCSNQWWPGTATLFSLKLLFRGIFITVTDMDAFLLGGREQLPNPAAIPCTQHSPIPDRTIVPLNHNDPVEGCPWAWHQGMLTWMLSKDIHPSCQSLLKNYVHLHCYCCLFSKVKKKYGLLFESTRYLQFQDFYMVRAWPQEIPVWCELA